MTIRILINGASGKMGRVTVATLQQHPDFKCVATTSREDNLAEVIAKTKPDIGIDFTIPTSVYENSLILIANSVRPIIGTSGLTLTEVQTLQKQCQEKNLGGIIAPNFSLGAILLMKYAKDAARYFPDVEIIEMHHPFKLDAPSGTANKTAQMIAEQQQREKPTAQQPIARGDQEQGVPIHSVRLPGLFAHEVVMFAGEHEMLTLRHDATDRQCCMPGVILACQKVMSLDHMVYGLENLID